jgi:hypothetical protein
MWDYSGYSNYHALQTGVTRRYDRRLMFSFFYVWSKAWVSRTTTSRPGLPNATDAGSPPPRLRLRQHRPSAQLRDNCIYQLPFLKTSDTIDARSSADWQLSGVYRWTSGTPQGVGFSIPGIGAANLTGSADGNPNARIVLTCDPGAGYGSDPYQQFNTGCFAPPQPGSDGAESRASSSAARRSTTSMRRCRRSSAVRSG